MLLKESGKIDEANRLFEEVSRAVELMPRHARRAQREWRDLAKKNFTR